MTVGPAKNVDHKWRNLRTMVGNYCGRFQEWLRLFLLKCPPQWRGFAEANQPLVLPQLLQEGVLARRSSQLQDFSQFLARKGQFGQLCFV